MNITILAAEILLLFVEGKENELWDRIAAIEKYRERYLLQNEETHRSQLFLKILVIFSKYYYDLAKFKDKAKGYIEELQKSPMRATTQAYELEIVPYEKLTELLFKASGKKRGKWNNLNGSVPMTKALSA
jgi:hypothetical protein